MASAAPYLKPLEAPSTGIGWVDALIRAAWPSPEDLPLPVPATLSRAGFRTVAESSPRLAKALHRLKEHIPVIRRLRVRPSEPPTILARSVAPIGRPDVVESLRRAGMKVPPEFTKRQARLRAPAIYATPDRAALLRHPQVPAHEAHHALQMLRPVSRWKEQGGYPPISDARARELLGRVVNRMSNREQSKLLSRMMAVGDYQTSPQHALIEALAIYRNPHFLGP